ncbi:hypothetical protein [Streptomyces sp. NPDC051219]|uniref:hypothetical protein n=1 Tax=Streptomyces sp. NPDC051219 TaxID=3155283 RepID=UPI0034305BEF
MPTDLFHSATIPAPGVTEVGTSSPPWNHAGCTYRRASGACAAELPAAVHRVRWERLTEAG